MIGTEMKVGWSYRTYRDGHDLTVSGPGDPATGLVSASRDSAGVETRYGFDSSGRVTASHPRTMRSTTFLYFPYTGSSAPRAEVKRLDSSLNVLVSSRLFFDGLGRIEREESRLPAPGGGDQWSQWLTEYDGLGRTVSSSALQPLGTSGSGVARNTVSYDPLGRQCKQKRPGRWGDQNRLRRHRLCPPADGGGAGRRG